MHYVVCRQPHKDHSRIVLYVYIKTIVPLAKLAAVTNALVDRVVLAVLVIRVPLVPVAKVAVIICVCHSRIVSVATVRWMTSVGLMNIAVATNVLVYNLAVLVRQKAIAATVEISNVVIKRVSIAVKERCVRRIPIVIT